MQVSEIMAWDVAPRVISTKVQAGWRVAHVVLNNSTNEILVVYEVERRKRQPKHKHAAESLFRGGLKKDRL